MFVEEIISFLKEDVDHVIGKNENDYIYIYIVYPPMFEFEISVPIFDLPYNILKENHKMGTQYIVFLLFFFFFCLKEKIGVLYIEFCERKERIGKLKVILFSKKTMITFFSK